jgi:hypothetical protein
MKRLISSFLSEIQNENVATACVTDDYRFIAEAKQVITDVLMDSPEEEISERSKLFYSYCGETQRVYITVFKQRKYIPKDFTKNYRLITYL